MALRPLGPPIDDFGQHQIRDGEQRRDGGRRNQPDYLPSREIQHTAAPPSRSNRDSNSAFCSSHLPWVARRLPKSCRSRIMALKASLPAVARKPRPGVSGSEEVPLTSESTIPSRISAASLVRRHGLLLISARVRRSFRCLRQWHRIVGKGAQVGDEIGTLVFVVESRKRHLGPRNIIPGSGKKFIEFVECPGAALCLHCGRIVVTVRGSARPIHYAVQVRAD